MQKYVNIVDLVKSFPTNIYLQHLASIQPRTSLSKFVESPHSYPAQRFNLFHIGTTPRTDTDTAEFDLESWANQCIQDSKYIQQQQQHKPNSKYIQDSKFVVDKLQTYHYGFGRIGSIAS